MVWVWPLLILAGLALMSLLLWRGSDAKADTRARKRLVALGAPDAASYDPKLVAALPEPAQRFFNFTIEEGTRLRRVVEIEMEGELSLGSKAKPNYRPMRARQLIAAPYGFVWSLKWNGVSGSDGALPDTSWTRFWLFNLVPLVHAGGDDHRRSSFGRLIADGLFWSPASMLPSGHVSWEKLGRDSARVVAAYGDFRQAVDLHLDRDGRPLRVIFQRWSNENPERIHRLQPFGGDLSDFKSFEGYHLPTTVIAGNQFGTEDYFPFFKAKVIGVRFPEP